ncbi:MAG: phytoene/squalene synthase family protein [Singulisphaera sp.]
MTSDLVASYAQCRTITRRTARNFYYSFLVLPRDKRSAMCALYAFLRATDDLSDSDQPVEERRTALIAWRRQLTAALDGDSAGSLLLPALVDTVSRFKIPREYLYDCLDGVEMDLTVRSYETFADLREYCYRVASVVGLACIHIWGFSDRAALSPASDLGVAFQLTNILRDLKEDADRGRVYLPQEDLRRFQYTVGDLSQGVRNAHFRELMNFETMRAADLYDRGAQLEQYLSRDGRSALRAMTGIYRGLLKEIKRRDGDVFSSRVRLSPWRKSWIAVKALLVRPAGNWKRAAAEAQQG